MRIFMREQWQNKATRNTQNPCSARKLFKERKTPMNIIIRLLTVSFMLSMFAFGMAGYAGSKSRSLPIGEAIQEVQTSCTVMLQDIKTLDQLHAASGLDENYYRGIEFPLSVAYEGINNYVPSDCPHHTDTAA